MDDLLADVEAFIVFSGVTASKLGRSAVSDPRFVTGLRLGREPRRATVQRVRAWMAQERSKTSGERPIPDGTADGPAWMLDGPL